MRETQAGGLAGDKVHAGAETRRARRRPGRKSEVNRILCFRVFPKSGLEFFMAIRFNNNAEFFLDNRAWYENGVRTPRGELAAALGPTIRDIDPEPRNPAGKGGLRINRDVRFSKDKSLPGLHLDRPSAAPAPTGAPRWDVF
jgi:hypothetical protein